MLFNSYTFWVFFLIAYGAFLGARKNVPARNAVLLLASYFFYGVWDWRFLSLLIVITLTQFSLGLLIPQSQHKKALLLIGVFVNLGILAYFKYAGFFVESFQDFVRIFGYNPGWPIRRLILPIGVSFYTFQSLSYTVDVYRGEQKPTRNLLNFALFVAFFPQLVAGPIERAKHLLPQIEKRLLLSRELISTGCFLIVWGLVKKVCIADNAALIANTAFYQSNELIGADAILGTLAFIVQIYADFSGYSDIAMGLAALMGFELVWNFRLPFFARSPSDFWKRWHVSLSEWVRDYLYIPLGGNRLGRPRTVINLLVVMCLMGLWHGAAWHFVVWGLFHGMLLVLYRAADIFVPPKNVLRRIVSIPALSVSIFFILSGIGWILFRSIRLKDFWRVLTSFGFTHADSFTHWYWYVLLLWAPILLMQWYQARRKDLLAVPHSSVWLQTAFYVFAFYALILAAPGEAQEFIYFKF